LKEKIKKVSVIGTGRLGIPIIVSLAKRGFEVVGVDKDKSKIDLINKGISPIYEPEVQNLLKKYKSRIKVTSDYNAIDNTELTIIIVGTPSRKDGSLSSKNVLTASEMIGKVIREKDKYHLIFLSSTVMPTVTELEVKPILEYASRKKCGKDFGLCYVPEFLALGRAVHDLIYPAFIVIGESDKKAGDIAESFYKRLCLSKPKILRTNFVNAEVAKIVLNNYITTKISFANTVAEICEKIKGADADIVTDIISMDYRINPYYLKGRLNFAGACFPRDQASFQALAKSLSCQSYLAEAVDKVNNTQCPRVVSIIKKYKPKKVAVLGLSFKPNTDVTIESPGFKIKYILEESGIIVLSYDPVVSKTSLEKVLKEVDLVVITTPWQEFRQIPPHLLEEKIVIDCWRILSQHQISKTKKYIVIGKYIKD